jgi:hypothetical protein
MMRRPIHVEEPQKPRDFEQMARPVTHSSQLQLHVALTRAPECLDQCSDPGAVDRGQLRQVDDDGWRGPLAEQRQELFAKLGRRIDRDPSANANDCFSRPIGHFNAWVLASGGLGGAVALTAFLLDGTSLIFKEPPLFDYPRSAIYEAHKQIYWRPPASSVMPLTGKAEAIDRAPAPS